MTATVNPLTADALAQITSHTYSPLSIAIGAIVTILIIVLLIHKEVVRSTSGARFDEWVRTMNIAVLPLLVAFGLIVVTRMVDLTR